jgi:hypothetical protein
MILSIYNLQINITSIVFYETSIIEKENSISLYRFYISTLKKKKKNQHQRGCKATTMLSGIMMTSGYLGMTRHKGLPS